MAFPGMADGNSGGYVGLGRLWREPQAGVIMGRSCSFDDDAVISIRGANHDRGCVVCGLVY
jgi:hypothetical protein